MGSGELPVLDSLLFANLQAVLDSFASPDRSTHWDTKSIVAGEASPPPPVHFDSETVPLAHYEHLQQAKVCLNADSQISTDGETALSQADDPAMVQGKGSHSWCWNKVAQY